MAKNRIIIKGGTIKGANVCGKVDIAIENERIAEVRVNAEAKADITLINVKRCWEYNLVNLIH